MKRRDFLKLSAFAGMGLVFNDVIHSTQTTQKTAVSLVKSKDRVQAVKRTIELLEVNPVKAKNVIIKPNFNSSDQFPGSTHNTTLRTLIEELDSMGAKTFTLADRSGMGDTETVMQQKGIFDMAEEMGIEEPVVIDQLPEEEWKHFEMKDTHWNRGVFFPKMFTETDSIIQTCCLKTHRFGGHFTMSLKNSVGMVAKFSPVDNYNFMNELHSSPEQRLMIAEINLLYKPDLIVLDGLKAFLDGGPASGELAEPGVMIAGTDRIAVDAVGVAILRLMETNPTVSSGAVFEQEQIKRAAELGIGVDSPEKIEIVVSDDESAEFANKLKPILNMSVRTVGFNSEGKKNVIWGNLKQSGDELGG